MPPTKIIDQERLNLYEFWKEVPTIIEVDSESFETIALQEVRSAILDILRKGIADDYTKQNNLPNRHALSAPEMMPYLKERLGEDIRLPNVYFHLEKLEKANLVRKITKRLEGKHYVTYYGRTCKLIIGGMSKWDEDEIKGSESLSDAFRMAEALNADFDRQKANDLVDKIIERKERLYHMEKEWLAKNHPLILDLDVGVLELFEFMTRFLRVRDPVLQDLLLQFNQELGLEIYSE
ncbi:MAG: hypothetical protein ACFFGZ_15025 [Candidatus Thorarchaeota archaeon]